MSRKNRISLNIALILTFSLIILFISIGSFMVSSINIRKDALLDAVERQSREQSREILNNINYRLQEDIDNEVVDIDNDDSIKNWCKDNLSHKDSIPKNSTVSVIRIYYNYELNDFLGNYIWSSSATTKESSSNLDFRYTSDIIIDQQKAKKRLNKNNIIDYRSIRSNEKLINDFKEENIIRYKNPENVQKNLDVILKGNISTGYEKYKWETIDNKIKLIEWTSLPINENIGCNGEFRTTNGLTNLSFEKIVILDEIDFNNIKSNYSILFKNFNQVKILTYAQLIIIFIFSIIFLFYLIWNIRFKKL